MHAVARQHMKTVRAYDLTCLTLAMAPRLILRIFPEGVVTVPRAARAACSTESSPWHEEGRMAVGADDLCRFAGVGRDVEPMQNFADRRARDTFQLPDFSHGQMLLHVVVPDTFGSERIVGHNHYVNIPRVT